MLDFLTVIVLLPSLGAGSTLAASLLPLGPNMKDRVYLYARYVALAVATVSAILVLVGVNSMTAVLSSWHLSPLFDRELRLRPDAITRPLTVALTVAVWSAMFVELARTEAAPPSLAAASLALLSAGLAALWAANPLTMILGWALYDLIRAIGRTAAGGTARDTVRELIFGELATLFLWGGILVAEGEVGSAPWSSMTPGDVQMRAWMLAGLLRLSLYPFHLSTSADLGTASPLVVPLSISPILGWGLWLRLVSINGAFISDERWLLVPAMSSLALGGLLAWLARSPRRSRPWIGMGVNGTILLSAWLTEDAALPIIVAGSVGWMLGVTLLSLGSGQDLSEGLQPRTALRSIPTLVGALTLAGAPLTLGSIWAGPLTERLAMTYHWGWKGGVFVGQAFLISAITRRLLSPDASQEERGDLFEAVAYGLGLGTPVLVSIAVSMQPKFLAREPLASSPWTSLAVPGPVGWLVWGGAALIGGVIAWHDEHLRPGIELPFSAFHDLLCLEWLYDSLAGAVRKGLTVLYFVDEILGGAGALLWSGILILVALLIWSGK